MSQDAGWPEGLTGGAQATLLKVAVLLASGFTGTIELKCSDGGITQVGETRIHRGTELERMVRAKT